MEQCPPTILAALPASVLVAPAWHVELAAQEGNWPVFTHFLSFPAQHPSTCVQKQVTFIVYLSLTCWLPHCPDWVSSSCRGIFHPPPSLSITAPHNRDSLPCPCYVMLSLVYLHICWHQCSVWLESSSAYATVTCAQWSRAQCVWGHCVHPKVILSKLQHVQFGSLSHCLNDCVPCIGPLAYKLLYGGCSSKLPSLLPATLFAHMNTAFCGSNLVALCTLMTVLCRASQKM